MRPRRYFLVSFVHRLVFQPDPDVDPGCSKTQTNSRSDLFAPQAFWARRRRKVWRECVAWLVLPHAVGGWTLGCRLEHGT